VTAAPALPDDVVSAAPQRRRLSILTGSRQLDVSLPIDVPIADLIPELLRLNSSRGSRAHDATPEPTGRDAHHSVWVLCPPDSGAALAAEATLRSADVAEGALLRLTQQRALSAPTHHDDVVDAVARLNKSGYPGWNGDAARWMAFAGCYLITAAWVYLLVAARFAPHRATLVAVSAVAALASAGVALVAGRTHGRRDIASAISWGVLPIAAAVGWDLVAGRSGYLLAAGCATLVLLAAGLRWAVGAGSWGHLCWATVFGLGGIALTAFSSGIPAATVGAGLAASTVLGCVALPRLTRRFARWDARYSVVAIRSAGYAGLAGATVVGAAVVTSHSGPAGVAFSTLCAVVLAAQAATVGTAAERAALAVPAAALLIVDALCTQHLSTGGALAAYAVAVVAVPASVAVDWCARHERVANRARTVLNWARYLTVAAVIPAAAWAAGVYGQWALR
jgi:hypothetical protein